MSRRTQPSVELLTRLDESVRRDPTFTATDVQTIHEMIQAYRGLAAMGKMAKWILGIATTLSAVIVAWQSISTGVKGLLRGWLS